MMNLTKCKTENKPLISHSSAARRIWIKVIGWFIQTVIYSLLPLILYLMIRWVFQIQGNPIYQYITELCTFTLVISSSVAIELVKKPYQNFAVKTIIFPAHLVLMIIFFMIYGAVMVSFELNFPLEQEIVDNIFLSIVLISGIHFVIAVLLQIIGGLYDD